MTGYVSIPDRQLALSLKTSTFSLFDALAFCSVNPVQSYTLVHHVVCPLTPYPLSVSVLYLEPSLTLAFPQQTHSQRPSRHSLSML